MRAWGEQKSKIWRASAVKGLMLLVVAVIMPTTVYAGPNYVWGNITDMTSTTNGLMIKLDTGIPDNCTGTGFGWMLLHKEDEVMISLTMSHYYSGKRFVTIYTNDLGTDTYCRIHQIDPEE